MLEFLESYLQKKLKVAEKFYLHGKDFSVTQTMKELDISSSTLTKYATEMHELYAMEYQGGVFYNSKSLEAIAKILIDESKKLKVLELLFTHSGETAKFYKDQLILSDATFSRIISQLRKDLSVYNVKIVVKEGYRLVGKSETEISMLYAYLSLFFYWPFEQLTEQLETIAGKEIVSEILTLDLNSLTFVSDNFEIYFYQVVLVIRVLRAFQQSIDHPDEACLLEKTLITTLTDSLNTKFLSAKNHILKYFDRAVSEFFQNRLSLEKKLSIKELLIRVAFHLELFPYKVDSLPLRMMFACSKYRVNYPETLDSIKTLEMRASKYLHMTIDKRYEMFFYYVITEGFLIMDQKETIQLYVYSSIGDTRSKMYKELLAPLLGFFSEKSKIEIYSDGKTPSTAPNSYLITTDIQNDFPRERQFLINDYLSQVDYFYIMSWLKGKQVNR